MRYLILTLLLSFSFSECDLLNQDQCDSNSYCEWTENIETGSCSSLAWQICENYPGCWVDSNPGWYDSSGPYCTGGNYQLNNSYCQNNPNQPTCSDMTELECNNNQNCLWVEDIEWGNCGDYNNGGACDSNENCFWDLCYGGWYGSWSHCCRGGSFQTDNSYCEVNPELFSCSSMIEFDCNQSNECEWITDQEWQHCDNFDTASECSNANDHGGNCDWSWNSTQWQDTCSGGGFLYDTSFCDISDSLQGDLNGDMILNILDVIIIVEIILNEESNDIADVNQDGIVNILDVIALVQIIVEQ